MTNVRRGPLAILSAWSLLALAGIVHAQESLEREMHHLGTPGEPEWTEFAAHRPERSLEVRFEFFNLFNKAQFSNPNTQFGNLQFGRITSTGFPSREIQLGARFLF